MKIKIGKLNYLNNFEIEVKIIGFFFKNKSLYLKKLIIYKLKNVKFQFVVATEVSKVKIT